MEKQYRFILIDDSLLDLFIHKKLISVSNLSETIFTYDTAETALEFLKSQGESLAPSIILLDLQMPGMNGFQFVEAFAGLDSEIHKKIRIFILSSTVDQGDISKAKANPFIEDMISKPVDVEMLRVRLSQGE
jgi:CheY-like chemotaxis protein